MNPTFRRLAALAIGAIGALALVGSASAASKTPLYKLTLKGSQVVTWSQSHLPQFDCDATVTGNGSESITYETFDPIKVALFRPAGKPALFAEPGDAAAPYGVAAAIDGYAKASREGTQNIQAPGGACNGTGGGQQGPAPDCGDRSGLLHFHLGYATIPEATPTAANTTAFLKLTGGYDKFDVPYGTDELVLGQTFQNCPFWSATAAAAGTDQLLTAGDKITVGKLAKLKVGKTLKLSGSAEQPYASGDFEGKTINAWNVALKRVR
jgi:hypothetical protein